MNILIKQSIANTAYRNKLARNVTPCPNCNGNIQLQLLNYPKEGEVGFWQCRLCGHKFEQEAIIDAE